jgi:two-component system response regulator ResD
VYDRFKPDPMSEFPGDQRVAGAGRVEQPDSQSGNQALLIEADNAYRAVMASCLRLAGCQPTVVESADSALAALDRRSFDLLVWGVSSDEVRRRMAVLAELRLRSEASLIVIDGGLEAAQSYLEAGADKWVPKPFVPGVLVGSIRAALRKPRFPILPVASRTEIQGMTLDGGTRRLAFGGSHVSFTRQEWDLFSILLSHPDRFLGAREILRLGWHAGDHAAEQLRTYVHRLRRKLAPLDLPCRLLSEHGLGYCLLFDRADRSRVAEASQAV